MIQEANIIKVENKTSKKGQSFLSLKTDVGNMSCWNAALFNILSAGQKYSLVTEIKNGFTNVLDIANNMGFSPANVKIVEPFKEAREEKGQLMVLSYIKDLTIACLQRNPEADVESVWNLSYKTITEAYKKLKEELK